MREHDLEQLPVEAVRARLDPQGCFANEWTDRVLGPVEREGKLAGDSADRVLGSVDG